MRWLPLDSESFSLGAVWFWLHCKLFPLDAMVDKRLYMSILNDEVVNEYVERVVHAFELEGLVRGVYASETCTTVQGGMISWKYFLG